jgi:hypothetical protein
VAVAVCVSPAEPDAEPLRWAEALPVRGLADWVPLIVAAPRSDRAGRGCGAAHFIVEAADRAARPKTTAKTTETAREATHPAQTATERTTQMLGVGRHGHRAKRKRGKGRVVFIRFIARLLSFWFRAAFIRALGKERMPRDF